MKTPRSLATLIGIAALVLTPAAAASAAPYNWIKFNHGNHKPLVMAHQGGEDEYPSETMYAFKQSMKIGSDSLELDIGVTKDDKVIVMHDTTVNRITNGTGNVSDLTLAQIRALDGAYWFSPTGENGNHYSHNLPASAYPFRGVATGAKPAPKGYTAADFRVQTLSDVLAKFPKVPMNIEIKGRTPAETDDEYNYNATVLGNLLKNVHRTDLVIVSFHQSAVDLFSTIAPQIPTAPGVQGDIDFFWDHAHHPKASPQTVAFQVPNRWIVGGSWIYNIANCGYIKMAHDGGYAWNDWFADQDTDGIGTGIIDPITHQSDGGWKYLLDRRVDGIMTAKPRELIAYMKKYKWNKATNICKFKGGGGY